MSKTTLKIITWYDNGAKMPAQKRHEISAFYEKFKDKQIELTLRVLPRRSNQENRFYWGVIVQLVKERMNEYGNEFNRDQTHEFLLNELSPVEVLGPGGEVIGTKGGRSSEKNSEEFSEEYIEKIRRFAAQKLDGLILPYPNEQSILFASYDETTKAIIVS